MKTIAGCILTNDAGQYLLVQEKQPKVYGMWNIPAGYAEDGESAPHAAARETLEEVGLEVTIDEGPIHSFHDATKNKTYLAFKGVVRGGQLRLQESEILNAEWLHYEAIQVLHDEHKIRDEWIFEDHRLSGTRL